MTEKPQVPNFSILLIREGLRLIANDFHRFNMLILVMRELPLLGFYNLIFI